jgi:hypothetical protein
MSTGVNMELQDFEHPSSYRYSREFKCLTCRNNLGKNHEMRGSMLKFCLIGAARFRDRRAIHRI